MHTLFLINHRKLYFVTNVSPVRLTIQYNVLKCLIHSIINYEIKLSMKKINLIYLIHW